MLMTDIRHVPLLVREPVNQSENELLQLAADAEAVLGYKPLAAAVIAKAPTKPLMSALLELGIEPLNPDDVLKYKAEQWAEQAAKAIPQWIEDCKGMILDPSRYASFSFYADTWQRSDLAEYTQEIPIHVINKAVQLKRAVPEVVFEVEALQSNPDPFLLATLGNEKVYIEVWAEPKFEAKL